MCNRQKLTLKEWIDLYEKRTGEKPILPEGFEMVFKPERGFAQFKADRENKTLTIWHLCGDGWFWRDLAEVIANRQDLDFISTICTRNIKAYIRFWKSRIVREEELSNGYKRYFGYDEYDRPFLCSPSHLDEKGNMVYFVNQSLKKGAVIYG